MDKHAQLFETARTLAPQFEDADDRGLVVVDDISNPYVVGGPTAIRALRDAMPFPVKTEPYGNDYTYIARPA